MLHEQLCVYERERREFFMIAPWSEEAEPPEHPFLAEPAVDQKGEPTRLPGETPQEAKRSRDAWQRALRLSEKHKRVNR